ncbi:hypothetical protein [Tahibacter amnicola]|uniref:Polysaccharide lyase-like protein n=1 Tax=Tahibacter amnicola TaxID=2976241 RepID=A0ABY6B845_9GAMM|nr:hypothetical protein [Tahibacter amnicola]UXI66261.1 hypothetical protein N4264_16055 [Tahibacter amnicola]
MTRRRALIVGGMSLLSLVLPKARARAGTRGLVVGKGAAAIPPYRYQQSPLFQPIPHEITPPNIPGTTGYDFRLNGATHDYVDLGTGWPWDNAGGDWLDANGVRQGPQPWYSVPVNGASGSTAVASYAADVTAAMQQVFAQQRWNAWLWRAVNAPRSIAGTHHATEPEPVIHVQYVDGSSEDLACTYTSSIGAGTQLCASAKPKHALPAFVEFEKPQRAVASAQLRFTMVEHWSGGNPQMHAFLLDPPVNTEPVRTNGIAGAYGLRDVGVAGDPNVLGVHRYVDGTAWSDFSVGTAINTGAEREYDPAIYGNGPTDTTKLPHRGLGKWINAINGFSLVRSDYTGEGFQPLTAGMGAMRVVMPAEPGLGNGSTVGYSGTGASNAKLFLPEADFGRMKRLFVRYYMRIGTPYETPFSRRYQVYHDAQTPATWTNYSGKIGICPAHDTSLGGVSGTSGGGYGWQMRLSWFDCDAERGGPNENALQLGLHTYDFQTNNPTGHRYGLTDKQRDSMFGHRGGLGSVIYPGRWYCIEMEVDLNTVMMDAPGYVPDGAVRIWLDGRMAYERTGMVMRTLPLHPSAQNETKIRAIRELGHRDLWFNWFHGGKTKNSIDRTIFITGLVWGRSYIGPMRLPSAEQIFKNGFEPE